MKQTVLLSISAFSRYRNALPLFSPYQQIKDDKTVLLSKFLIPSFL